MESVKKDHTEGKYARWCAICTSGFTRICFEIPEIQTYAGHRLAKPKLVSFIPSEYMIIAVTVHLRSHLGTGVIESLSLHYMSEV